MVDNAEKLYKLNKLVPLVLMTKTQPRFKPPPNAAVPYNLPFANTRLLFKLPPSASPEKMCSAVKFEPSVPILKTEP